MSKLETDICLKPGHVPRDIIREVLRLILEEFRWFVPARHSGTGVGKDRRIQSGRVSLDVLVSLYHDTEPALIRAIELFEGSDAKDFLFVNTTRESFQYPYASALTWCTRVARAADADWAVNHLHQVATVMRLLESPLAITAHRDDVDAKHDRLVKADVGLEEVSNLRDYSEGLEGVYWRNFYGPPFVEMFGDRLGQLPVSARQELEGGIVVVQPYALPTDAFTEAGKAREREFIQVLGPECFFDHGQLRPPTRRPRLPASWIPG